MMVLCLYSSFSGVTLDLLLKCSVMEGLSGCRIKVVIAKNLELVQGSHSHYFYHHFHF